MQNFSRIAFASSLLFTLTTQTYAQVDKMVGSARDQNNNGFVLVTPHDLHWMDGPESFPRGAQYAVLDGNLKSKKSVTVRIKFPANYQMPAHFNITPMHLTVLSGTLNIGMGDKLNTNKGTALAANSFTVIPARKPFYSWTNEETVVQVSTNGPVRIKYINADDDPRKNKSNFQPNTQTQPTTVPTSPDPSIAPPPVEQNIPNTQSTMPETNLPSGR